MTKSLDIDGPVSICPLGFMCIDFDGGIRLNDLIHAAGEGVNSTIIQCVHDRVLLEYAYFLSFICFQWITYV